MATQLPEDFWLKLERELPLLLTRRDVKMYCGSLITPAGLANLDSKGRGPTVRLTIGKYRAYERTNFIEFLRSRVR